MARIAYTRRFNGTSDEIQLDASNYGGTIGAQSYVALAKHASGTGFQWIVNVYGNGGSGGFGLGHQSTNNIAMHQNDTARTTFVNATWQASDGWTLVAATRADGNSTPRLHRYFYSIGGASWVHEDVSSALTESGTPAAPAQLWLGTREGSTNFFAGDIACVGLWQGTALSDTDIETLVSNLSAWKALSPTGLWLLDQHTATTVRDLTGNGHQIASNGTTAVAISDLPFDTSISPYATEVLKDSPVAYWRMDEASNPGNTPILDNFNRADGNVGANWSTPIEPTYGSLRVISNEAGSDAQFDDAYWGTQFTADQEVYVTLTAMSAGVTLAQIYARVQNPNTAGWNAYKIHQNGNGSGAIAKIVAGAVTYLGGGWISGSVVAGDKMCLQCIGSTITAYKFSGGAWSVLEQLTGESSVTGAGYIGLQVRGETTTRYDDFGGGNVIVPQDSSGGGKHTTAVFGSPSYLQPGALATDFGSRSIRCGLGAYFDITNPVTTTTDNWTIEAWMKLGGNSSSNGRTAIRNGTTAGYELDININGTFYYYPQGGTQGATSVGSVSTTEWKLIHLIRRNGVIEYYINGVADTIGAGGTAPGTPSGTGKIGAATGADFYVDEVAIYDTALPPHRIRAHYDAAFPPAPIPPVSYPIVASGW